MKDQEFIRPYSRIQMIILVSLRLIVGYHFLHAGIEKAAAENWTSAGYLLGSEWLFSSIFNSIALSPVLLSIIDFLNIWGQIIIGLFLIIGFLSRIAAFAGAFLLTLYYIASPPFIYNEIFINLILLELMAFLVVALFNTSEFWGIDRLIKKPRGRGNV